MWVGSPRSTHMDRFNGPDQSTAWCESSWEELGAMDPKTDRVTRGCLGKDSYPQLMSVIHTD